MSAPKPSSRLAARLLHACLDGDLPVASGSVHDVAGACAWMIARAAAAFDAAGRSEELLGAVLLLACADCDRSGYTTLPGAPPGEPHPASTGVWLVTQEAAGRHDLVDQVMTEYLSWDLTGRTVILAQVTAALLRLVDGPGAHATVRAQSGDVAP